MFGFIKKCFYSDFVRSQLRRVAYFTTLLCKWIDSSLASLYKAKLDRQYLKIRNDVNQELRKNKIMYSEINTCQIG